jgi:hypothetical protein
LLKQGCNGGFRNACYNVRLFSLRKLPVASISKLFKVRGGKSCLTPEYSALVFSER